MIEIKLNEFISIKSDWPKVSNEKLFTYTKVEPLDVDLAVELGMVEHCIEKKYTNWNAGPMITNWNSEPICNNKGIDFKSN